MSPLCIFELLDRIDKNDYERDKSGVESKAVQFWHTSDFTQPLDLSVYGPYKKAYRQNYAAIKEKNRETKFHERFFTKIMTSSYKHFHLPMFHLVFKGPVLYPLYQWSI